MKQEHLLYLLKSLIFFAGYYFTARFGLQLDPVSGFATLFWLPTGISLAVILLWGYKFWPAIAFGAFLANLTTGAPLFVAGGMAVGNTLEAVVGAYLLQHFIRIHFTFDRLIDVWGLVVFAGLVSTFIGATIGVTSLLFGGIVTYATYTQTWFAWWIGDMVSNLLIAPLILIWSTRISLVKKPGYIVESFLWMIVVIGVYFIVFDEQFRQQFVNTPRTYWIFPPLVWAALRFGQRWTITALVFISMVAVWSTLQGAGPFVDDDLTSSLMSLHIFMGVIAITSMILAAVVSERKALERRKDNFISIASHELKTPLTSSKSYIQILKKQFLKEKSKGAKSPGYILEKADAQLDRLSMLINDLLDVSKIQSGKFELRQKRFDVDSFVQEYINSFQQTSATHKVIRKGEIKTKIIGDDNRLGQVLTNFLTNALKYSPNADKIIVTVTRDQKMVTVSVQDFGIGISREAQKKIFEPFFQIDGVKREGLGLGLHIASEIVKVHGGIIMMESKKGRGSTFSFSLPLQPHRKRLL
jgi:signal transduction histidine kinase